MTPKAEYHLCGFLHPIGDGQSFLVPIFLRKHQFWIQEIDLQNQVHAFQRISLAGYIFPSRETKKMSIGSPGIFAFYTGGGTVLVGRRHELAVELTQWVMSVRPAQVIEKLIMDFVSESDLPAAQLFAAMEKASRDSPAGTEDAVALVKAAVAAANKAFESVQLATKHAVELAEKNFQAATGQTVRATRGSDSRTSKKRA